MRERQIRRRRGWNGNGRKMGRMRENRGGGGRGREIAGEEKKGIGVRNRER